MIKWKLNYIAVILFHFVIFFIKTELFNKTATKTQKYSISKNNG